MGVRVYIVPAAVGDMLVFVDPDLVARPQVLHRLTVTLPAINPPSTLSGAGGLTSVFHLSHVRILPHAGRRI